MKIGIYPGSFDPITKGHLDIIKRASKFVDVVIVGVLNNSAKTPAFSVEERVEFIKKSIGNIKNVQVESFSGLLMDFVHQKNADVIIRGLRALSDFEYEFQIALANRRLDRNVETIFLMTSAKYSYLSSSIIRELAKFGGNIGGLVPGEIFEEVSQRLLVK